MTNTICKSDLLMAGWHEITRDNHSEWHHPRLNCRADIHGAKRIQKLYGVDSMGELNVTIYQ